MPGSVRLPSTGPLSAFFDDLREQLLRVVLVPFREILPRGDLDFGGLGILPFHVNSDIEVAFLPLQLPLVATVLRAGGIRHDTFIIHDGLSVLGDLIDRCRDHRLGPATGQIDPGAGTSSGSSKAAGGGQNQRKRDCPSSRHHPRLCHKVIPSELIEPRTQPNAPSYGSMGLGVHRLDHRPRVIRINPPSFPNRRTSYFSESETRGRSDPVSEDHPDCDPWRPHIAAAVLRGSGYLRAGVRADLHPALAVCRPRGSAGAAR